ncbi:MAG: outer membrane lipoprotein-sorting protein [Candidatus Margulisbacteria bacterium]|nr:outer membrane lipoprotein-sorting protein [Candidatus Margulisiibacteriota bacterium]
MCFFNYLKFIIFTALVCFSFSSEISVTDMMKKLDDLQEMKTDITARVNITQQKVNQGIKVIDMVYYRRDKDDAFMIVMTAPEAEKGNGYLKIGDNFWMYRRNTRTFQHINRDESIAGSDASADDFEKRKLVELYKPEISANNKEIFFSEKLGDFPVYKFKLTAKVKDVKYPSVYYWVRQDNFLPLKEQQYSLTETLMETAYFMKYTIVDGRYVWVKGMFIDEFEKGNKTVVEISGISTKKLDDSIFTKAYLENLSK